MRVVRPREAHDPRVLPQLRQRGRVQVVADADDRPEQGTGVLLLAFATSALAILLRAVVGELDELVDEPAGL